MVLDVRWYACGRGGSGDGGGVAEGAKRKLSAKPIRARYGMRIVIFLQQHIRLNGFSSSKWILERKSNYNIFAATKPFKESNIEDWGNVVKFVSLNLGHTVSELGYTIFGQPFLGSSDNAGFLYVKPTYQVRATSQQYQYRIKGKKVRLC